MNTYLNFWGAGFFVSQIHRIEVAFSDESLDSAGISVKNAVSEDLGISGLEKVRCTEAYYLHSDSLDGKLATEIAQNVLSDKIIQSYSLDTDLFADYDFLIEVRLHHDVTDNLAIVTSEAISDYYGKKFGGNVTTSRRYYFWGGIDMEQAERIATGMLANPVVEAYTVEARK